jgi:hypothetical protein
VKRPGCPIVTSRSVAAPFRLNATAGSTCKGRSAVADFQSLGVLALGLRFGARCAKEARGRPLQGLAVGPHVFAVAGSARFGGVVKLAVEEVHAFDSPENGVGEPDLPPREYGDLHPDRLFLASLEQRGVRRRGLYRLRHCERHRSRHDQRGREAREHPVLRHAPRPDNFAHRSSTAIACGACGALPASP